MAVSDHPLINSRLPTMANWICVYAIVVSPLIWCANLAACTFWEPSFSEDSPWFVFDFLFAALGVADPIDIASRVLLLLGGMRLRALRRSGVTLLQIGIWLGLGWTALLILATCLLLIRLAFSADDPGFIEQSGTASDVAAFVSLIVYCAESAFLLASGIWLVRYHAQLPLSNVAPERPGAAAR